MANRKSCNTRKDIFTIFTNYLAGTTDDPLKMWPKMINMLYVIIDWIHNHVNDSKDLFEFVNTPHNVGEHDDKTSDIVISQLYKVLMGKSLQNSICAHAIDKTEVQRAIKQGNVKSIKKAFEQYLASEDKVLDLTCREAMVRQTMVESASNNENQ